jgi:RNA polymerase sigma factor (sigma-70 family)
MRSSHEKIQLDYLVLQCQQGNREAFDQLYQLWSEQVWKKARKIVGEDEAAWDIFQEVWTAVSTSIRRLEQVEKFPGWLMSITSRRAQDWIRKESRQGSTEKKLEEHLKDHPPPHPRSPTDDLSFHQLLEKLSKPDRTLLTLRYEHGYTILEIAKNLSIPQGTVKSRLYLARQRAKIILEEHQK